MNAVSRLAVGLALTAAVYHLYFAYARPLTEGEHAIIHVGFATLLIGLDQVRRRVGMLRGLAFVCLAGSLVASVYLFTVTEDLEMRFGIGLTDPQLLAGVTMIAAVVILCWMEWGIIIAALAVVSLAYFFLGYLIPGPLRAAKHPSFDYAMTFLISSGGTGLYGQITPISASVIFLFMIFGSLLASTGVTRLFMELGNWLGRIMRGGAAVTCVVSSSLLGTVTGATVANVAITGTFTIPTMKKQGFRAEDAGALEAVASCGGQVLPPVMGAGAFIMAAYLGISYIEIAARALVPALAFYASVLISIFFLVRKAGKIAESEPADFSIIRGELVPFLAPLITLVYFLMQGYSATTAVVLAISSVIAISILRPRTWRSRDGFRETANSIIRGLISGAEQGAALAIITAAISLVAQSLITTALGPKFASALAGLASGQILPALLLVAFASLLLGCGLPTIAAYTMVAIMMVPALKAIGIDPLASHLFVYYFAVYAAVTPPVATAAIVASRIAETSFWRTAWAAMRVMSGPLILPFLFIYRPEVLQFPPAPFALIEPLLAWFTATIAFLALTLRHILVSTTRWESAGAGLAGSLAVAWIVTDVDVFLWAAVVLIVLITVAQSRRRPLRLKPIVMATSEQEPTNR
ncbi:TRAP transporter permease [Microbaculum sp. FT89]|uniref:TRAP transporter permease n=1 Tax=Microbaculum sp. FT89 TaxID=3447298 RepID=UPI003F52DADC